MTETLPFSLLIVDDDAIIFKIISTALAPLGAKLKHVVGGIEAVQVMDGTLKEYDCVILDHTMPSMYGIDLVRVCEHDNLFPPNRFIILSGAANLDREPYEKLGVTTFLSKPFSMDDLETKIKHICSL